MITLFFQDCVYTYIICFFIIVHPPRHVIANDVQPTSVLVSWQAVECADIYHVTLTQTMGDSQLGLCSASHNVSVNTSSPRIVVGKANNDLLRAYTTYSITVVAMSDTCGSTEESEPITVTTHQTCEDYYCAVPCSLLTLSLFVSLCLSVSLSLYL